jgi:hypothetical protein
MRYYKIFIKKGTDDQYIYPSSTRSAVWKIAQYHYSDMVMIGGTDTQVRADGKEVVELAEKEALSMIEQLKKSHPKPSVDMPVPPQKK